MRVLVRGYEKSIPQNNVSAQGIFLKCIRAGSDGFGRVRDGFGRIRMGLRRVRDEKKNFCGLFRRRRRGGEGPQPLAEPGAPRCRDDDERGRKNCKNGKTTEKLAD